MPSPRRNNLRGNVLEVTPFPKPYIQSISRNHVLCRCEFVVLNKLGHKHGQGLVEKEGYHGSYRGLQPHDRDITMNSITPVTENVDGAS